MKPAPFAYCAPECLEDALVLLKQHECAATLLAGGQSLMPLLNLRVLRPALLIDLNNLADLSGCQQTPEQLVIGAMTRQSMLESATVRQRQPLLTAAVELIGNFQIRNRGTVGGSLAMGNPASELAAVALALDAQLLAVSADAPARTLSADTFFVGNLRTALAPTEILTSIRFPVLPPHTGWSIQEISQRQSGVAIAGTVALLTLDATQRCIAARFVVFAVQAAPSRVAAVEQLLLGQTITSATSADLAAAAVLQLTEALRAAPCQTDIHASADYRREVTVVLARRSLDEAMHRALQGER